MRKFPIIALSVFLTASTAVLADNATVTKVDGDKTTMNLFNEIKIDNKEAVKKIISTDKSALEIRNSQGQTPLMYAVYQNNAELAKELILAGADVNAQDNIKNSPFLYAGAEGQYEILKLALSHGAKFDIYNRYGGTALIPAAEKGHIKNVELLANTPKFPIDHVNNLGWTALMEAIVLGSGGETHTKIIEILLKAGANPNIPDKNGVTALTHAKQKGFKQIVKLLESSHAK